MFWGKNLFAYRCRLHRVAANLVVVSICNISLVGVVAIGVLLIDVVVVFDVTFFAFGSFYYCTLLSIYTCTTSYVTLRTYYTLLLL